MAEVDSSRAETPTAHAPGHIDEIKRVCHQIAQVKSADTQVLFGSLHEMATLYYQGALEQASQSFRAAQIAAIVGTVFFLGGIALVWWRGIDAKTWIGLVPGVTIQVISGLNFHMYAKATKQFELFHVCLERMGRYLMANSVSDNIESPNVRDETRRELVRSMMNAPMLPTERFFERRKRTGFPRSKTDSGEAKIATA